jgi:hypothetical protein
LQLQTQTAAALFSLEIIPLMLAAVIGEPAETPPNPPVYAGACVKNTVTFELFLYDVRVKIPNLSLNVPSVADATSEADLRALRWKVEIALPSVGLGIPAVMDPRRARSVSTLVIS